MILLKQYRGGQAMAVRELMIIMLIINTIPCVSVSYARRLMRLVLMLMGQGKCSLLIDGNSVYTNGSRRGRRLLDISSSLPPPPPPSLPHFNHISLSSSLSFDHSRCLSLLGVQGIFFSEPYQRDLTHVEKPMNKHPCCNR